MDVELRIALGNINKLLKELIKAVRESNNTAIIADEVAEILAEKMSKSFEDIAKTTEK